MSVELIGLLKWLVIIVVGINSIFIVLIGGWVLFSSIVVWLIEKAMMQFKIWKYIATFIHYRKPIMRWIKEQKVKYDDEVEVS